MKIPQLKNTLLVLSGMMIAASVSIFAAQNTTTIEANLVNLRQYLKELYITSTGTPAGDVVMHIDGSGEFQQIRGNASLINSSDNYFGVSGFVGSIQEGTGGYTYINGIVGTEDPANFLAVVLNGNPRDYIAVQSGGVIMTTTPSGSDTGYDLDLTSEGIFARGIDQGTSNNMTRQDGTKLSYIMRLLNDGTLMLKNYIFPLADGLAGQVITTDGNGQLYWADAGGSSIDVVISTGLWISYLDIQNMGTNPIEIIPEPGEGKFVQVLDTSIKYNPGSVAYTMPGGYLVLYQGGNPSEFLFQFSNILSSLTPSFSVGYDGSSMRTVGENESVKLSTEDASDPIDGDGSIEVYVTYKIIDLVQLPN